jgi:N-acyl-D-aspartate/D-glutamate deacylase
MAYDLVIRNGFVVDGSGMAPVRADVGVVGDRIAAVGRISDRAGREIDAEGHVVTPGFVDGHTHMDAQVFWDELGSCSCWHGVTTVVMGNCGFSLAPAKPEEKALVVRNLERAEDISGAAMDQGIRWEWGGFADYLDAVDRLPKAINYAAQIGHSALRTYVMGERAFEQTASDDDLAEMGDELERALRAGAIGLSTSRSPFHETSDDRPVASRIASCDEVRFLVKRMGEVGSGVFESAFGPAARTDTDQARAEVFRPMLDLAIESAVPFTFGVAPMAPHMNPLVDLADAITAAGGRSFGQSHSRGVSVVHSFETALPFDRLPEWQEVRRLSLAEQQIRLKDPETRARLVAAADAPQPAGERPRPDYRTMRVLADAVGPHAALVDVAASRGVHPVEALIDLALESGMTQLFDLPATTFERDAVLAHMKHPRMVMTFSDSGAHVSQVMDSSIQTHLFAYWVRREQAFTLEEAVRMVTYAPATAWGFADRGLVREGFVADLNVFDPDRIAPELPVVVNDLPGGEKRLLQKSTGIKATVVAGQVTLVENEPTGARPGQLLRTRP